MQLPEIEAKRQWVVNEKVHSVDEVHVDQTKQLTKIILDRNLDSLQVKASVPIEMDLPPTSFSQRLQNKKLEK